MVAQAIAMSYISISVQYCHHVWSLWVLECLCLCSCTKSALYLQVGHHSGQGLHCVPVFVQVLLELGHLASILSQLEKLDGITAALMAGAGRAG